jgi:hypothetical protein
MTMAGEDVVHMDAAECATTDKVMIANAERPWTLWKRSVRG